MTLGAQLYSIRDFIQTPEDTRETFRKLKAMGYENVQLSGGGPLPAEFLRDLSQEFDLPIASAHDDKERLVNDIDALIREHEIMGCPVLGCGMMPKEYRKTLEGLRAYEKSMETSVKKIRDAGMRFAYHNHDIEFVKPADDPTCSKYLFDIMVEELDWNFIVDTCWVQFAGEDPAAYLEKVGTDRLWDVHFKDMKKEPRMVEGKGLKPDFVPCGEGILDFPQLAKKCAELNVLHIYVEQDNAVKKPDPFDEMRRSFDYLKGVL